MKVSLPIGLFFLTLLLSQLSWASGVQECDGLSAPTINSEKQVTCAGQPIILKAAGCGGVVRWSNGKTGTPLTVYPSTTTTYEAYCQKDSCKSALSNKVIITVTIPATPLVTASKTSVCLGDSVTLKATGCTGSVIWSNGMLGATIQIQPINTTKYTATCRSEGCVSCFADDVIVSVLGGEPLLILAAKSALCKGESTTLTARGNCSGQIKWSTGEIGKSITIKPETSADYSVVCVSSACKPVESTLRVEVAPPTLPSVKASKALVCLGEEVTLTAEGCNGAVLWNTNDQGRTLTVKPTQQTQYTAVCVRGECQSGVSNPIVISVQSQVPATPVVAAQLQNSCPFVTVDLSSAIQQKATEGVYFEARTGNLPSSPLVADVGAVSENRTYYLFARNAYSCYSAPAAVTVNISQCDKPLAVCINNPATATITITERTTAGNQYLEGKIGGSASVGTWATNGTGTFNTTTGLSVVYTPSPEDRQAGKVTVRFSTDDPDGDGPCKAGTSLVELKIDATTDKPKEMVGINKLVKSWKRLNTNLFEIEFSVQVVNMGANDLVEVRLVDSLDKVFINGAVMLGKPTVSVVDPLTNTEVKWGIDTSFTGKEGAYELLIPEECNLVAGQARAINIKTTVDFTNAQDSVFYNTAFVTALDINGNLCTDKSANGNWPDINQNEDPTDDTAPTPIALNTLRGNDKDVFIPEGFSPNSDGVNDFFVIKKPITIKASVEIFNRWGGLVYQAEDYKNDWNGGLQGVLTTGTYFYVIKLSDGREFSRFLTISR